MTDSCMGCGAPIMWVLTEKKGKRMPLDIGPAANGNVTIEGGIARVVLAGTGTHVAHFVTCPKAGEFRKR